MLLNYLDSAQITMLTGENSLLQVLSFQASLSRLKKKQINKKRFGLKRFGPTDHSKVSPKWQQLCRFSTKDDLV